MWRALRAAGFMGFPEGHLWYDLIQPFAWWRDPEYKSYLREDIFTLGAGRNSILEKRMALLIDGFHRDLLSPDLVRWVSKSPGLDSIMVAPMLAEMFPQAQFIFMKRNAIMTVNSTVEYVSKKRQSRIDVDRIFRSTCEHWVRVMRMWREVRSLLAGRYVEVAQERIVTVPDQVAREVTIFLHASEWSHAVAEVFKSRRENTAFPEKSINDFFYSVNWTGKQRRMLSDICGSEMAVWGYPLDFQKPGGPDKKGCTPEEIAPLNMESYYHWIQEQPKYDIRHELQMCKELLTQIKQGRVMRLLLWLDKVRAKIRAWFPTKR